MSGRSLSPEECRMLLGSTSVGRVVFTDRALPSARPVHYVLAADGIVFPTDSDGLLGRMLRGMEQTVLGFETDEVDEAFEAGWSVQVVGLAAGLDPQEAQRLDAHALRTWVPGDASTFVRIPLTLVTGWTLGATSLPLGTAGVAGPVARHRPVA